ncbi:MAG: DHH family phosphoesterase [Nitrososphaerota archaeon]|jgi:RecJ-like exonuclease|nr:DHH family phosphoesterase [Nitrososphaerota archaeon]MDG6942210.1 DHH family phosphoesterase [Nitrososphaerota archaeon]MDG6942675.1 DHH family phosphoesterase [Nitrososphaerota archaeon]MDG6948462.1 DHH family phosphoesterase [Nitrososphaerota archaeon]MDG6950388.1 DHH family phosphoesterase [Nitrososphaerota archaeon]
MADFEGLFARYRAIAPSLLKMSTEGKRILVVSHIDADGLCSGTAVFAALERKGANVTLRTVPDLDAKTIGTLKEQGYEFIIFTDLGSALVKELEAAFGDRFLVVDHHQISEDDIISPRVVNAWAYGFDGGKEACSSAMAYFLASAIDPANADISPLAVVGAVADRQDSGPGRSLTGLNRAALGDAQGRGLISTATDLLFTGRETRPIHEAIALTSTPFLKGLTGARDVVLAVLHQSGLSLKDGGTWRTISSLSQDEKKRLVETLAGVVGSQEGASEALSEIFGEVYTLRFEDAFTPLRDAREFGTLLNSCGRMGASGTGISICLGDRSQALKDAMKILSEYRGGINRALTGLTSEASRVERHGSLVFVNGEGLVDEKLLGPVISILTSAPEYKDKVVVGRTTAGDSDIKISSRVGDAFAGPVNLGSIMKEAAEAVGGVGGGHEMAAGAKIPSSRADSFSRAVLASVIS